MTALGASPAAAGWYEFSGTLEVTQRSKFFRMPPIAVTGSGVAWSSRSPLNEIRIYDFQHVEGFAGTLQTTSTLASRPVRLEVHGIGDAHFAPSGTRFGGPMGIRGFWKSLTMAPSGATEISIPLTVYGQAGWGLGGTYSFPVTPGTVTWRFAQWTVGTAAETDVVTENGLPGTLSAMGFDARTANGLGQVQLVTPMRAKSGTANAPDSAVLTTLTLEFVPEPARALGLAAGSAALLWLGVARRRGLSARRRR